jgi:hypothetical protein
MGAFEFRSKVGSDGTLNLRVLLGAANAGADVLVTIRKQPTSTSANQAADWHAFVEQTYGSCTGSGLERRPQGKFEEREAIE